VARPRLYEEPRICTAVRLPESLHDELLRAAAARDVSMNFLVTRAIADYLRRLPDPDPDEVAP
jgi:predicted HicB family RNase H-like nuclease